MHSPPFSLAKHHRPPTNSLLFHKLHHLPPAYPQTYLISIPNLNKIMFHTSLRTFREFLNHKAFMLATYSLLDIWHGRHHPLALCNTLPGCELDLDACVTVINIPYLPGWNLVNRRRRKGRDPRRKRLSSRHDCHPLRSERQRQSYLWLHITQRCYFWKSRP